ncbi:multicopper oxidase family protein [Streptomyces sp. NPDC002577]
MTQPSAAARTPRSSGMSRRRLLSIATGSAAGTILTTAAFTPYMLNAGDAGASEAPTTTPLPVPPELNSTRLHGTSVFRLEMRSGTHEVLPGVASETRGFNGTFLGPTIRLRDGERVRMEVTNRIGEDTTVHWHGGHVPPREDGGMQTSFADGTTWTPEFTVNQQAATLWYHPHPMGASARQLAQGLAGMLIVDDDSPASRALPHDYGVDDIPVVLQCMATDPAGTLKYDFDGYNEENVTFPVLTNGVNVEGTTLTHRAARTRLRLRFLNASLSDVFTVSRADGAPLTQVATESALLPEPAQVDSIRLVAASRAEIVIDVRDAVQLQATVETAWVEGGSGTYPFLRLDPPRSLGRPGPLPARLNTVERFDTSGVTPRQMTLTWNFTKKGMGINGVVGTSMEAMMSNVVHVRLGELEVWDIVNTTGLEHSFHIHGVPFQIVSVDGTAPTGVDLGWKDTVEIRPEQTVRIAMRFTDYADDEYMYMMHCHITPHEDEGMMGMIMVMDE